jgi:OPT family oligopeptide transporter
MAANPGTVAPVSVKTSMSYDDSKVDDFERKSMGSDEGSDDYKDTEVPMRLTEDEIVASLPPWYTQITSRAIITGLFLGTAYGFITMRFALGPFGVVPTFNMPMGLTAFLILKPVTAQLLRLGWTRQPFTAQENTVVQTFAMAMVTSLWILGFGSYLQAMDYQSYLNAGGLSTPGNFPQDTLNPFSWRIWAYGFCIVFMGVFVNLTVRKPLVIDYNLPYPTGTAVGTMIRSFFNDGANARQQALMMFRTGLVAFTWGFWTWFTDGVCTPSVSAAAGFVSSKWTAMPNLGAKAFAAGWYFDFNLAYVGAGFITPISVNYSMMVGAILSWGIAWPLLRNRAGDWYPADLPNPANNFQGEFAYHVFWSIALFLGDGAYQIVKMAVISYTHWLMQRRGANIGEPDTEEKAVEDPLSLGLTQRETPEERRLRKRVFMKDDIHWGIALGGYIFCLVVGCIAIPHIYPPAKWYYLIVAYLFVPFFALANAYAAGLTDQDNYSVYGQFAIFIFSAWAGTANGGVIAGLAICGVVVAAVSQAAVLMQDFKTGYYTLASPKALFVSQLGGAFFGVLVAPGIYKFYTTSFPIGVPNTQYSVPFATVYRLMSVVSANGFHDLPDYCLAIGAGLVGAAIAVNLIKDFLVPGAYKKFVPLPSAVSIPFFIGAPIAIDFCMGGAIMLIWRIANPVRAALLGIPAGAGLLVGDGLWQLPLGILGIAHASRPLCMAFFRAANVDL